MPAVLRLKLPVKNVAKQVDMSYQQKLRGLYCHPIAPVLVASSAAAFYPFVGLATWAPTMAVREFAGDDYTPEFILAAMGTASLVLEYAPPPPPLDLDLVPNHPLFRSIIRSKKKKKLTLNPRYHQL